MPGSPPSSFDSVVLAAVVQELAQHLPLRVLQVDPGGPYEVVLRTHRGMLLLSAEPQRARVHFARHRPQGARTSSFVDLLRARIVGAHIVQVHQPPFERILELHLEAADGPWRLVLEPMGKHANLVLVREDRVVGVARPVPPDRSRVRPLLPGLVYRSPPRDPRPTPGQVDPDQLDACLAATAGPLWRRLLQCVAGIGPLLSYELAWRTGDPEALEWDRNRVMRLSGELGELAARVVAGHFNPRLYGPAEHPVAFSPLPCRCLEEMPWLEVSMSEAVERVLDAQAQAAYLHARRAALLNRIQALLSRKVTALEEVHRELEQAGQLDRLREWGQLLLAYAHQVPRGASSVTLIDSHGKPVNIPLNPERTAVQNAQELFRRYAKLRAAQRSLPQRAQLLERELEALHTLKVCAETASGHHELDAVEADLPQGKGNRQPKSIPRAPRVFTLDGFAVLVGRSNRDNDRVTFHGASPRDLWFHARGLPGAHVVLKTGGKNPSEELLRRVASLAAYYSAGRHASIVDVDYTERCHVRKPPGSPHGLVTYRRERTVRVPPLPPEAVGAHGPQPPRSPAKALK